MSLSIQCSNGCGVAITVEDEELAVFRNSGKTLEVAHEICPRDRIDPTVYTIKVTISKHLESTPEDVTLLATAGSKTTGESLESVFPELTAALNTQWEQVRQMSSISEGTE